MDRTEAIDILRVIAPPRTSKKAFYDFMEARDMAIAALEGKDTNVPSKEIIRCKDCYWWTKQEASLQGRCALSGTYPTGAFFCGNARERGEMDDNN